MRREDIEEVQAKREKKEVAQARRRGRKGNNSISEPVPRRGKQTRAENLEEADCEIDALGLRSLLFRPLGVSIIGQAYCNRCCCSVYCHRWNLIYISESGLKDLVIIAFEQLERP